MRSFNKCIFSVRLNNVQDVVDVGDVSKHVDMQTSIVSTSGII